MGHKEETESISCLVPRTELSAVQCLVEFSLVFNTKKSVLHFKPKFDPHCNYSQDGTVLSCFHTGQPLEPNRTHSDEKGLPPSTCAHGGRMADTGECCFFDLPLLLLCCLKNQSPPGSNTQVFLWQEKSIHFSLAISGAWRLLGGTSRQDNKQRQLPKQVPLEQTANRALLSSGFWLLHGENHC